ncbi:MAG: CHAT domain-containing protein [Lysobacter sp.]
MATHTAQFEVPWADLLDGGQLDRVNLAFLGRSGLSVRLARLVFLVLAGMTDHRGRPAFRKAVVLLPADVPDTVMADVVADAERVRGFAMDDEERDVLARRLQVHHLASFDTAAVLKALVVAAPGSFVIVVEGARYRPTHHTSVPPTPLKAPEDRWIAPLIALATQCVAQIGEGACVLVDVGEYLPALARNLQAVQDLECTVWGGDDPQAIDDAQMAQLQDWTRRVERGDILSVLGEVDALAGVSAPAKLLTKTQILHNGGRTVRALEVLREWLPHMDAAAADLKLKLATVALAGEDLALARQLLASSADDLCEPDLNELALELTQSIPSARIEAQCLDWLNRYFPASSVFEEHQLRCLLLAARDGHALREVDGPRLPLDDYANAVLGPLNATAVPDYANLVLQADARWPAQQAETRLAAALDARRRALPMHVALLVPTIDPHSALARHAVNLLLWSIERLILTGDEQTREELADAVLFVLLYLAVHPGDTASRERLDELLSIDIAGSVGVALLAHALMRLASAPAPAPIEVQAAEGEVDAEQFLPFYRAVVEWLSRQRAIDLATVVLPEHLLSMPADTALHHLKRMAQFVIEQEQADDGDTLRLIVLVAFAVAPHATRRNDDLEILRLATSRLVVSGEAQLARDLVEAGLAATQGRPERLRLAWYAYGDVFHRMHNGARALLAFGCAIATQAPVEREHAYYETMGVVRALRDTGLMEPARQFLDRCEQLLVELGIHARMGHRVETVRLGLQISGLQAAASRDVASWSALLRGIDANLEAVIREDDELATVLVMAVQAVRQVEGFGVEIDPRMRDRIQQALDTAGEITAELVQLASNAVVGPERLIERARAAQHARYSEDVGFDVHYLVRAARSQLSDDAALADPVIASFSAELTTDHAIALPGDTEGGWLPATVEEPARILQDLSRRGLSIEVLAVDSADRLVRVSADAGQLAVRREGAAFSLRGLQAWSLRYPFEYGLDHQAPNVFYTSMRDLGLSDGVGERVVFVLDTRLQRLPPQLLLIEGELLGRGATIAVAPSLTWLHAAATAPRKQYAPPAAWISTAVEGNGSGTLVRVAERVADVLDQHGIALQTGAHVPGHLKGARLAIVAAHGGLADDNRFFKVVSDEAQLRVSALALARALEGAGVVVLFVCSGGRQDEHPVAATTVGLPKQLLDRGSAAVIASPWPLDSRVPSHWLPAFLAAWEAGAMLVDANAAGNDAVGVEMGNEPRHALAMTLYGNPFILRADLVDF